MAGRGRADVVSEERRRRRREGIRAQVPRTRPRAAGGGGSSSAGGSAGKRHGDSEEYEGKGKQQRVRRSKEELVTFTRRPDAEALYDKPITLRELFPKEFWRI